MSDANVVYEIILERYAGDAAFVDGSISQAAEYVASRLGTIEDSNGDYSIEDIYTAVRWVKNA